MAAGTKELDQFVRQALLHAPRERIVAALLGAGWPARQVDAALGGYVDGDFPVPVPRPRISLSAQEAFFYLVLFSALYFAAYHLCSAVFDLVNLHFPDPDLDRDAEQLQRGLRWSVAALVTAFPLFLFMSWHTGRDLERNPAKRLAPVRRWLTYLTLFLAAVTLMGDFTTLVYNVLNGDLSTRFLFKVASLAFVGAGVFGYYLWDLRREERPS